MKILKGLFYTVVSAFVTLFLLAFCCSLVNRGKHSDDGSYLIGVYEEELDKYVSEIEDQ